MSNRIEAILSMLERTPDDVFLNYSLAMEYASVGDYDKAAATFKRCVELDEEYLPAYVEGGKCLRSGGNLDDAREIFTAALKLAESKGEAHIRDYIRQQLEGLPLP